MGGQIERVIPDPVQPPKPSPELPKTDETADMLNTPEGQQAYERLKDREKGKQRIHIWENCRTDVKGNRSIMQFAPSLAGDFETVYREKLWPEADLTSKPRHLTYVKKRFMFVTPCSIS